MKIEVQELEEQLNALELKPLFTPPPIKEKQNCFITAAEKIRLNR